MKTDVFIFISEVQPTFDEVKGSAKFRLSEQKEDDF